MVINFLNAVKDALSKGLQVDIVPDARTGYVIVMIAPQSDENGDYQRVFQDEYEETDIKGQTDLILHAIRQLTEEQ